jgi:hypothetical protein
MAGPPPVAWGWPSLQLFFFEFFFYLFFNKFIFFY